MQFKKICVIVMDSVGIGELPDAAQFGDTGSHTLGHISERMPDLQLLNLRDLGLGNIAPLANISAVEKPLACYGKMNEISVGKDTMTGHWELMGLEITKPFQVYPNGFPKELLKVFEEKTGRGILGNKPASGTEILEEFGEEQRKTGKWIVYTSADSVFQLAANEEVIPLEELYNACEVIRALTLEPPYMVGRVIARPYIGQAGAYVRTPNRHDYALAPFGRTVLEALTDKQVEVTSIGKISDIFSGKGISASYPTKSNEDGILQTIKQLQEVSSGFIFTNLVDFDSLYGHRRDVQGYGHCLEEFDRYLPDIMAEITQEDLLIITADHGNDPIHPGTDHTREYVPLLVYNPTFAEKSEKNLGIRATYGDLAATLAENFGTELPKIGNSFLKNLL
ncbi:phosphopentomutase [Enterococcus sp. BWR-S5]|uniref:phosphopentomutase n=1 Tax=Enterococcus sp. BWR-S5 TaxID=2787714 RepID=UPI001920B727|nr:phosphopentomutase [Enterococcus sp. BWR-S5]MBL1225587.1 phosphopentomutase [Enterococcus sp. BWR-S5]